MDKYLKYKNKYLQLKYDSFKYNLIGGNNDNKIIFKNKMRKEIEKTLKKFKTKYNIDLKIKKNNIKINNKTWTWDNIKKQFLKENPDIMKLFFDLRKNIVDDLINKIFKFYSCKGTCTKIASGSVGANANLGSDYDLTINDVGFKVSQVIQTFNSIIKNTFHQQPFIIFDTNLYAYSALLPLNVKINNTNWKPDYFNKHLYLDLKMPNINQDKWALIRLKTFIHDRLGFSKENHKPTLLSENHKPTLLYNGPTFNFINIKNKLGNDIIETDESHKPKLYLDKMKLFEKLIHDKTSDAEHIAEGLSYMNFYGDETYFTLGAFKHVVGTMFYYSDKEVIEKVSFLNESDLVHSMIENLAYFIHSILLKNDVIIAVKYMERFMDAYKLIKIKQESNIIDNGLFSLMNELKNHFRNRSRKEIIEYLKLDKDTNIDNIINNKKEELLKLMNKFFNKNVNLSFLTNDNHKFIYYLLFLLKNVINNKNSFINIEYNDSTNNFTFNLTN